MFSNSLINQSGYSQIHPKTQHRTNQTSTAAGASNNSVSQTKPCSSNRRTVCELQGYQAWHLILYLPDRAQHPNSSMHIYGADCRDNVSITDLLLQKNWMEDCRDGCRVATATDRHGGLHAKAGIVTGDVGGIGYSGYCSAVNYSKPSVPCILPYVPCILPSNTVHYRWD